MSFSRDSAVKRSAVLASSSSSAVSLAARRSLPKAARESARAGIKVAVKRILSRFGYPPDLQDAAIQTVLLQAETLCRDWVA